MSSIVNFARKHNLLILPRCYEKYPRDEYNLPKGMDEDLLSIEMALSICYYPSTEMNIIKEGLEAGLNFTDVSEFYNISAFNILVYNGDKNKCRFLVNNGVIDDTLHPFLENYYFDYRFKVWHDILNI